MKKFLLSAAIMVALFTTAFASPAGLDDRAVAAFQKDFNKASDVQWVVSEQFVRASFVMEKKSMFAYYDFDGNMIGLVEHILTNDLPLDLQKTIKKNYSDYWVSDLFQVSSEHGTSYYVQLKNADETIVLSTEGANAWHTYQMSKINARNL